MIFLGLFIFLLFLLAYFRKKNSNAQSTVEEDFWARENEANHTRRQDISGLPYITIPLENFPMGIYDNSELMEYEELLTNLSHDKILNLEGESNTDLKLKYGPANLDALTACDDNYATLCRTIVSYAECLLSLGHRQDAQKVLETGISCGCDHSKNYLLLADLYLEDHNETSFENLLRQAEALTSPGRDSILKRLSDKKAAFEPS